MGKSLDRCKSGKEIIGYIERNPQVIETRQSGSHFIAKTQRGMVVVPNHNGDLPTGTLRAILKTLKAIGIAVFIGAIGIVGLGALVWAFNMIGVI